jgi:arabinogalactan oligomer/maltooligosaccharide transport system permease protein
MMTDTLKNPQVGTPKVEKYRSYKTARLISKIIAYILLVILAVVWIYPLLWIVICSFTHTSAGDPVMVPNDYIPNGKDYVFGFQNYVNLFQNGFMVENGTFVFYFPKWFGNTLFVAVFSCIISTCFTLMVAYVMSKLKFSWRKTYLNFALIIGLFPGFMSMVAIYYMLKAVGLTGELWALILCNSAGAGTGFYVAKGFFDVVPDSLVESARLDGATNAQIFLHIILPMSKPIIIYQALMAFTGPWMDFIFAKVILGPDKPESWTVAVGLYNSLFGDQVDTSIFTVFAAGCVCVAVPIVTVFMFLQKYYVEGVTAGSVK